MSTACLPLLLACCLVSACVGPDIGQNLVKSNTSANEPADCAYCLQVPQITAPSNLATVSNTQQKITLAAISAEACEYDFTGAVTLTAVLKKSTDTITEYTPTATWPLDQTIRVTVRCFDSEDTVNARATSTASAEFSVSLQTPSVQAPWSGYATTSNLVRLRSSTHGAAAFYVWEITQGANSFAHSSADADSVFEIPFPVGVYGNFSVRTRYRDANNVYSAYSPAVLFTIKDRSAGTAVYSQDFTAMPICGDKTVMLLAGCNGVNILGTYPSCDSTGWFGGGGNVYMCNTGFENTIVLQTVQTGYNSLPFYTGVNQNMNVTNASIEIRTHQHGTAEDAAATVISCRAYPAEGNDGFSFVIYPYRTSGVNVEIRNRRFADNAFEVIASAYRAEAQLPALTWFRFDCLGNSFTGYYKNASEKWVPLIHAQSTVIAAAPHRIGVAAGQGNQWIKLRVYSIDVKDVP